jgi:hypothetical protein
MATASSSTLSLANRIRQHCIATYVGQAKAAGHTDFLIRAGDVHTALGLNGYLPAVCEAIGTDVFEKQAGIRRIAFDGPINGANAWFWFRLDPLKKTH